MWGANDAGHSEQGAVGAWFLFEDVQGDPCDDSSFESFDQGGFFVDTSACAVDQADSGFKEFQLFHSDEVFGFLGQGRVDRQVIDLG